MDSQPSGDMAHTGITLTLLTGPYAGHSRTAEEVAEAGIGPGKLLVDLARRDTKWEVTWPSGPLTTERVTEDPELQLWAIADLVGRVFAAALHGRPIRLLGQVWEAPDPTSPAFAERMGELEDLIVDSGRLVGVVRDDEHGLVLGTPDPSTRSGDSL